MAEVCVWTLIKNQSKAKTKYKRECSEPPFDKYVVLHKAYLPSGICCSCGLPIKIREASDGNHI